MSSTVVDNLAAAAVSLLHDAVDALLALPHERLTDEEEITLAREIETAKRRLVPVDHAVLNQLTARSVPFSNGCRSTGVFLSELLRLSRAEATARVSAAELLGARRTLSG